MVYQVVGMAHATHKFHVGFTVTFFKINTFTSGELRPCSRFLSASELNKAILLANNKWLRQFQPVEWFHFASEKNGIA